MPITSSKSDQTFQRVSMKESTPWTNRSVVLEKNWKSKKKKAVRTVTRFKFGTSIAKNEKQ